MRGGAASRRGTAPLFLCRHRGKRLAAVRPDTGGDLYVGILDKLADPGRVDRPPGGKRHRQRVRINVTALGLARRGLLT